MWFWHKGTWRITQIGVCVMETGLPWWLTGKESTCQCRRHKTCGFNPRVRKIPWKREWKPTPVFLPRELRGQRSLVGYSPWDCKESDTTERLTHSCWSYVTHLTAVLPTQKNNWNGHMYVFHTIKERKKNSNYLCQTKGKNVSHMARGLCEKLNSLIRMGWPCSKINATFTTV